MSWRPSMRINHQNKSSIRLADLIEEWVRSGKFKFDYWLIPARDGYYDQLRPFTSRFKSKREFFCLIKQDHIELLEGYLDNKPILIPVSASDPSFFMKLEGYLQSFKDCPDDELYSPS